MVLQQESMQGKETGPDNLQTLWIGKGEKCFSTREKKPYLKSLSCMSVSMLQTMRTQTYWEVPALECARMG